ncbi:unnamed protein product [Fusarium graminearum]|nr:unnamed protein product [Fusarium graminearum]
MPVAPNREFWMHVLEEKIKATIGNEGDMIGWPSDKESVGPIAFSVKQVPSTSRSIYTASRYTRPFFQQNGEPIITSLFDWETACIWPAVLSDPLVARLYEAAPDYKAAMKAGGDFRYLWYSLQDWRGNDPEGFFGDLGAWAEERIECLKVT